MSRYDRRHPTATNVPIQAQSGDKVVREAVFKELQKMRTDILNYATKRTIAAFIVALHDREGFGPKRIQRVLEKVDKQFKCVDADTVSLDDLLELCKEIGVEVQ